MIVYIYDKRSNKKIATVKEVSKVASCDNCFILELPCKEMRVEKVHIKLVIYGF